MTVYKPRMMRLAGSNPATTSIRSSSKHILRNSAKHLFHAIYDSSRLTRQDVKDNVETIAHALESEDEGHPYLPVQCQEHAVPTPRSIPGIFSHAHLLAMMRHMVLKESKRIYTDRVLETIAKAAEKAHSGAFQIGFVAVNDGL